MNSLRPGLEMLSYKEDLHFLQTQEHFKLNVWPESFLPAQVSANLQEGHLWIQSDLRWIPHSVTYSVTSGQ